MKVYTRTVWQLTDSGMVLLEADSYDYAGPVATAKGGSQSSSSSSAATNTQNLNLQEIDGIAVAGVDGSVSIESTDHGAIDAAAGAFNETIFLAGDVVDAGARQTGEVLDFARNAQSGSFELVRDTSMGFQESLGGITEDFIAAGERLAGSVIDFAAGSGERLTSAAAAIQARESGNTDARLEQITRVALIGAAVLGAGAIYAASSK